MVLFFKIIERHRNGIGDVKDPGHYDRDAWTYVISAVLLEIFVIRHLRRGKFFFGAGLFWDVVNSVIISALVADILADFLTQFVYKTFTDDQGPTFKALKTYSNGTTYTMALYDDTAFESAMKLYGWLIALILPLILGSLVSVVVYWVEFGGDGKAMMPSPRKIFAILRGHTVSQVGQIYSAVITIAAVAMYVIGTYETGAYRAKDYYEEGEWGKLVEWEDRMRHAGCPISASCDVTKNCTLGDGWKTSFNYLNVVESFLQPSLILDYFIRFFLASNISAHFAGMYQIADFLSISEMCGYIFDLEFNWLPSFGFLKFLRMIRILNLDICKSFMTEVQQEIGVLFMIISSMFVLCAGMLQSLEVNTNEPFSCFHTCLYNGVVTLTTIGFGDMNPASFNGKIVVSAIITIGVGLLAKQIANLQNVLAVYPKFGGRFVSKSDEGHVIVGGNLTDDTIQAFVDEFFHQNHQSKSESNHSGLRSTRVVILTPQLPSPHLKKLIKSGKYPVTYFQGSTRIQADLNRVSIVDADAIFVMSNKMGSDPQQEDISVIMSTIAIEKTRRDIPTFVQVINKSSIGDVLTAGADVVVCANQYRETIFASSAHCSGLSTFFGNLSRSCDYDGSTYADGCDYELYSVPIAKSISGQRFDDLALSIYELAEGKMVVLGVYTNEQQFGKTTSLLERRGSTSGLSLPSSKRQVTDGQSKQLVRTDSQRGMHPQYRAKKAFQWSEQKEDYLDKKKEIRRIWKPLMPLMKVLRKVGLGSMVPKVMHNSGGSDSQTSLKRKLLNLRRGGTMINPEGSYVIKEDDMLIVMAVDHTDAQKLSGDGDDDGSLLKKLAAKVKAKARPDNSTRMKGLVKAGTKLINAHTSMRSGCRPILDYNYKSKGDDEGMQSLQAFMDTGIGYDEVVVPSFRDNGAKYVVVVGHWSTSVIRQMVLASWRRKDEAQVVFMDTHLPDSKDWQELSTGILRTSKAGTFPNVKLVKGSPLNHADLKRAGIEGASAVCIVSDFGYRSLTSRSLDGKTIKISLVIRQFQNARGQDAAPLFPIYELVDHRNVSFIDQQTSYVAKEVALAPVYRGGHLFVPTMLDTLLCQSFFNPQITSILELLLPCVAQIRLADDEVISNEIEKGGYTYGAMFDYLLKTRSSIAVGLYSGEILDESKEITDNMKFSQKLQNFMLLRNKKAGADDQQSLTGKQNQSEIPSVFTNPRREYLVKLDDIALLVPPATEFNTTWGLY